MAFGIIYKITCNVNGKVYIGQTIRPLEQRFKRHLDDAFATEKPRIKFQRAIRKYGKENFTVEKIDECFSQKELDEKEKTWIKFYDSIKFGYNTAEGSRGGNTYAGINREQMVEIKSKIGKANKGRNNGNSNQVKAFSVKTNKEYFFETLSECLEFLEIKNKAIVMDRANKKINSLWRHEWKFAYENDDYGVFVDQEDYNASLRRGKKVILTKDGKQITFDSMNKAGEYLEIKGKSLIDGSIVKGYQVQIP